MIIYIIYIIWNNNEFKFYICRFCSGEHPCLCGRNNTPIARFDGSKGTKNFIIGKNHFGLIYRYDKNVDKSALVTGT